MCFCVFFALVIPGFVFDRRINAVAKSHAPPYFITVYGGLRWTTTTGASNKTSLFTFWGDTIDNLDEGIVPVGAQEMAR